MKLLFLSIFLLFSTNQIQERHWVGSFDVYYYDDGTVEVKYDGNYKRCFTKDLIDQIFDDCDSSKIPVAIDSTPTKIKTKGM